MANVFWPGSHYSIATLNFIILNFQLKNALVIAMNSSQEGTLKRTLLGLAMESTTAWHIFGQGGMPKKGHKPAIFGQLRYCF